MADIVIINKGRLKRFIMFMVLIVVNIGKFMFLMGIFCVCEEIERVIIIIRI